MERKTNFKLGTRLLVLLCLMGLGLIIGAVAGLPLIDKDLLAMVTIQDVMAFIVPAVAAMAIFYRRPLSVMCLDKAPGWLTLLVIVAFYVISLPAMNWLVHVNQDMALPSWMAGLEQWMRNSEDAAAAATEQMLDIHTVGRLLLTVLVVGFLAGLSEEMLFRGAMLRTMQDSTLGTHAVVWIVAIVFSAFHMQFYGFVPRMVLGVWLGYLLVWSRSLWAPIIAHTLNNSTVVLFSYLANVGLIPEGYGDNLGLPSDGAFPWLAVLSLVACIVLAAGYGRYITRRQPHNA